MMICPESDMNFILDEDYSFKIEKSNIYKEYFKSFGFATVEFVVHKPKENQTIFIEAKPNIDDKFTKATTRKGESSMANNLRKFKDSFAICSALWFSNSNYNELPKAFNLFFGNNNELIFLLIYKNCKLGLLRNIRMHLQKHCGFTNIGVKLFVINENMARKDWGLVQ